MAKMGIVAAASAAGLWVAQPCAARGVDGAQFERPPSAFAGLTLRLAFDPVTRPKPSVRLQFTADPGSKDEIISRWNFRPQGLEIGLLATGKPAAFIDGQSAVAAQTQLGLGGSGGQTALIVGGVLLAVVVVAVAAGGAGPGDTCPTINGSRDHCINL